MDPTYGLEATEDEDMGGVPNKLNGGLVLVSIVNPTPALDGNGSIILDVPVFFSNGVSKANGLSVAEMLLSLIIESAVLIFPVC